MIKIIICSRTKKRKKQRNKKVKVLQVRKIERKILLHLRVFLVKRCQQVSRRNSPAGEMIKVTSVCSLPVDVNFELICHKESTGSPPEPPSLISASFTIHSYSYSFSTSSSFVNRDGCPAPSENSATLLVTRRKTTLSEGQLNPILLFARLGSFELLSPSISFCLS